MDESRNSDSEMSTSENSDSANSDTKESSILKNIGKALNEDSHPTEFCGTGELDIQDFNIKVEGIGQLNLPLGLEEIKKLISISNKAKFGQGENTVLDETFRSTHEITKEKLEININNDSLKSMLVEMGKTMGLNDDSVLVPHLHNLLIYETGNFFNEHQDTEKLDSMIATLVIVLPYPHTGGNLIIKSKMYSENTVTFSSSNISIDKAKCIAFYSDCYHKIEKVLEGYRIVLTYNLVLKTNCCSNDTFKNSNQHLLSLISEYFSTNEISISNLAYILDHEYSQKNLKWDTLKGSDLSKASTLRYIGEQLGLEVILALVTIDEKVTIYEDDDFGSDYSYQALDRKDDQEYCLTFESFYYVDLNNKPLSLGKLLLLESQVCLMKKLTDLKTFKVKRDHMGNTGGYMDTFYRCGAVILWPKSKMIQIKFKLNYEGSLTELFSLIDDSNNKQKVLDIINTAESYIHGKKDFMVRDESSIDPEEKFIMFIKISIFIENGDEAMKLLSNFDLEYVSEDTKNLITDLFNSYGSVWSKCLIKKWIDQTKKISEIDKFVSTFLKIMDDKDLVNIILEKECNRFIKNDDKSSYYSFQEDKRDTFKLRNFKSILSGLTFIKNNDLLNKVLHHVMSLPKTYPHDDLIKIYFEMRPILAPEYLKLYKILEDYLIKYAEEKIANLKKGLEDWSIKDKLYCTCKNCLTINKFLISQDVCKTWTYGKAIADHILHEVKIRMLPVEEKIESNIMSKMTISLTKTDALHNRIRRNIQKLTTTLEELKKN